MPHSGYAQVEITTNDYTDTVKESCGHGTCNEKILEALGIGDERYSDKTEFDVSTDEDTVTVVLRHHLDEQDSCTWCVGCGDFLVHGLSCDCAERGYDPEKDREPMEVVLNSNGEMTLELRPFR
jgi:hypothetical protein